MDIRDLTGDDLDEVLSIYNGYLDTGLPKERRRYLIENYPSKCALIDNKIVGFCYTSDFSPDILCIANIFVAATVRSSGIGGKLLLSVLGEAYKQKFKAAILSNSRLYDTKAEKKDPSSFYLRHGFDLIFNTDATSVYLKEL